MELETAVFEDHGLLIKTGSYPKLPKGSRFNVEIGVLRNVKRIAKKDLLTICSRSESGLAVGLSANNNVAVGLDPLTEETLRNRFDLFNRDISPLGVGGWVSVLYETSLGGCQWGTYINTVVSRRRTRTMRRWICTYARGGSRRR